MKFLKNGLFPILAALAFFLATPAQSADLYVKGGAMLSNLSDMNTDNLGFNAELGLQSDGGFVAGGIELSNHRHLADSVLGIAANGYLYPVSLGPVDPYAMIGVGASDRDILGCFAAPQDDDLKIREELVCIRDNHQPFTQAAIGAEWNLTDSFALTGEGRMRCYHSGWGDILQIGDYGDADCDTTGVLGGKFTF